MKFQINNHILLRSVEENDTADLYKIVTNNRERFTKWFDWVRLVEDMSFVEAFVGTCIENEGVIGRATMVICVDDKVAGLISHQNYKATNDSLALGYWLDKAYEGQGIMTQAVRVMIDYAFELGINKVEIYCAKENVRSRNIPKKLGFVEEGVVRAAEKLNGFYNDNVLYGMLREEWLED